MDSAKHCLCFAVLLALALQSTAGAAAIEPKQISAHLANEIIPLTSSATTVGGLLDELSIELPHEGAVDPPPDAALKDGMQVFMRELSVTRGSTQSIIEAETVLVEKWHFGPERTEISAEGRDGLLESSFTIFFLGDEEVGRRERRTVRGGGRPRKLLCYRTLDSGLSGPSAETILAKRVKPDPDAVPPQNYIRKVSMESTAYEPGPESCGIYAGGKTACGLEPGYGIAAVDPDVIELGTRLFVEGYGYCVAGDTGGAVKGHKIDLCFLSVDECYDWGRREVAVYILP